MRHLCLLILLTALPVDSLRAEISGIVIVRHAEKADDGTRDPDLTAAGRNRAGALADALAESNVVGLIASQYRRTRQTLAALAARRGLTITTVSAEPGALEAHIDAVIQRVAEFDDEGVLVIAGHSNTVPLIVEALSGSRVATIDESEYDRLFVLIPSASGMNVVETRYGAGSPPRAR
jgi:phosphohistidine phosphatase SixA